MISNLRTLQLVGMLFCLFSGGRIGLRRVLTGLSVVTAGLLAHETALAQSAPKWGASINFEARPGTKRNLGEGDLFAPLAQTETSLLFGNIRGRFDDDNNREGNFGLGFRHMFAGWNFGAYGYYDRKRTDFDNYFSQATFGVEALGRDFDFRANAYLPFGDRMKDAGSIAGGPTYASVAGTTIQVITPGSLTRREYALGGFDAEIGWRVPIWAADDTKALRLYAGMFHFDDSMVKAVTGPRLRAELTMYQVPYLWEGTRLTLGAEFQHDDVRGSQGFGLIRLSVPLQPPAKDIKLTAQDRRMTDRIVRDVDIVTQARTTQTPTIVETATQTAGGKAITVINSATTAGNDLDSAVTAAGNNSTVILNGTFQVSGPNSISLAFGQSLMGGAIDVRTASGRVATLNSAASIIGTNLPSTVVTVNAGGTLSGLTVTSTTGSYAVRVADGATGATIANNTINSIQSANNAAIALALGQNTSATVIGNTLTATGSGPATTMTAFSANVSNINVTFSGNTLNASGGATNNMVWLAGGTTINAGSTGNVRGSGNCTGAPASGFIGFTDGSTCP